MWRATAGSAKTKCEERWTVQMVQKWYLVESCLHYYCLSKLVLFPFRFSIFIKTVFVVCFGWTHQPQLHCGKIVHDENLIDNQHSLMFDSYKNTQLYTVQSQLIFLTRLSVPFKRLPVCLLSYDTMQVLSVCSKVTAHFQKIQTTADHRILLCMQYTWIYICIHGQKGQQCRKQ